MAVSVFSPLSDVSFGAFSASIFVALSSAAVPWPGTGCGSNPLPIVPYGLSVSQGGIGSVTVGLSVEPEGSPVVPPWPHGLAA
eukprot:3778227-Pleurochrysis_carterae.AAC.1